MAVEKTGAAGSIASLIGDASVTYSYTVAADADCLGVGVAVGNIDGAASTISSVTCGAVAMTQVVTTEDAFASGPTPPLTRAAIFRLTLADGLLTGAQDIVVTIAGGAGTNRQLVSGAQGFKGVDQATPVSNSAAANSGTGTSATADVTVTSASGEWTLDTVSAMANVSAPTQNQLWLINDASARGGGSDATGAASVPFQWTLAASDIWSHVAVSFKATATVIGFGGPSSPIYRVHLRQY